MVVGVCRLGLFFAGSGSLKNKRQGMRRVIDRVRSKFNAAVAEVADQDVWQRGTVGICVVGNDGSHVQSMIDNIIAFVEQLYVAQIVEREFEILHYSDEERFEEEDL